MHRHGESTFNAARRVDPVDPLHFDAPLSKIGRSQVTQARATLARYSVTIVLTSPLTRALQTAHGSFDGHLELDGSFGHVRIDPEV